MNFRIIFSLVTVWLLLTPTPSLAEKRVALVIGNGAYQKVARLTNPTRDALSMAELFRRSGFDEVVVQTDATASVMRKALRDFAGLAQQADIAVIFYAGHGIEVNGTNYLVPVDAALERDLDVEDETVLLDRLSQVVEPAKRLRLILLDACRDNPFARSIKRTMASRSIGRGLGSVEVSIADTMIAFAARPGATAADGEGANSPYTAALLKHLVTPGLDLRLAMGRVRDEVILATNRRQEPIAFTSLGGAEIALVNRPNTGAALPEAPKKAVVLPADARLVLTDKGLGPFTKNSAMDLAAARRALPEYDVKLEIRHSEGMQFPKLHVTKSGRRVFSLEGEGGRVSDIMVFSSDILDANSVRVGMRFGDLPREAIRNCFTGVEENSDKIICENSLSPTLQYWFVEHRLRLDGDQPLKPSRIPASAKLWAIRWVPALAETPQ